MKTAAVRQQYMSIPQEIEATPINKTTRRICKCPEAFLKPGEFHTSAPKFAFGPLYRDLDLLAGGKEDAWQKVLEKEAGVKDDAQQKLLEEGGGNNESASGGKDGEKEGENKESSARRKEDDAGKKLLVKEVYMCAIRRIEKKSRAAYGDGALNGMTESEFRWMMIKDGCFFLQLALYILGANYEELGYFKNHLIFGKKQGKKSVQGWIKSMFFLGNQIPLVVLNELMKQCYFQMVIKNHGQWQRPLDMLSKQILYDLLVIPALEYSNLETSSMLLKKLARTTFPLHQEQPSDLLHGLQLLLLGPGGSRNGSTENEREDELEDGDLEAGFKFKDESKTNDNANEDKDENTDEKRKQLCASNLQKKGIYISKSSKPGIREIDFTNWIIFGRLSLPTLKVNHDTNVLFTNLKYYEITQQQKEVRSYLRFLNEVVSTYEDVNVLASKGIIEASTWDEKERFLEMLRTLADKETTHYHRAVIGRVKDYSVFPWERFKYVAIIVFLLTIAQTVFGVLSYVVGLRQLHESRG